MKTSKIKMMLAVVLSLVMVFSLAACGGGSTESAETTEEPAPGGEEGHGAGHREERGHKPPVQHF